MNDSKLPISTKVLYGFGSMAFGIKDNAFAYFLLFVYVQVFGLSPDLAGLAILLMLVFDAISDPLVGYFFMTIQEQNGAEGILTSIFLLYQSAYHFLFYGFLL